MKRWLAVSALVAGLCLGLTGPAAPAPAAEGGAKKQATTRVFEVCKHGCRYRTIQRAVDAAGSFAFEKGKADAKAVVRIKAGRYLEGVVVDGTLRRKDFDGLTIMGATRNRRRTILEGRRARGEAGAAQNGIEAIGVDGIVLKNMWARDYRSNGFFVHASREGGGDCDGYTMENLLTSSNRSYGLFAESCRGGRMVNSAGYHHGGSAFYVGETPCDSRGWTNHGVAPPPAPCQRNPRWTLLKNDSGYENVLGYSGTNSKYVKIVESVFYNNGAGIVPNTLDSEGVEPNGWNVFERNDVFWNNYNYFLSTTAFHTVSAGLGQVGSATANYPTGVGFVLYGGAGNVVRRNNVFGNYKWGIASFSGPGEFLVANEGDDAKNINNEIVENIMGREGADPNGEYDIWNDATGGGNCWGGNSAAATFAPGNGTVPLSTIYPPCPQAKVLADQVRSLDITAGLQINTAEESDPKTILGYAAANPPQNQQCSWVRRVSSHPPFQRYIPMEAQPLEGELSCR
jgi:hypothetical protein